MLAFGDCVQVVVDDLRGLTILGARDDFQGDCVWDVVDVLRGLTMFVDAQEDFLGDSCGFNEFGGYFFFLAIATLTNKHGKNVFAC